MLRPITLRGVLVTLLTLLTPLFAVPASAGAAAWRSPVHVGGTTGVSPSPGVDASGNAIVGWQEGTPGVIHAARHTVGTPGFALLPNVSSASPFDSSTPVVVLNRSGSGLIAWIHTVDSMADKEIDILTVLPNGKTGALTTVSASGTSASNITAAINADGDAVVAWQQGAKVLAVTRHGVNGAFTKTSTPDTLDPLGTNPVAAIDGSGNAIVVMEHHTGIIQTIAESHHLPGGSTWSPAATLSPTGGHAFTAPDVAANAGGAIVVAFLDNGIVSFVTGTTAAGWGTPTVKALSADTASHGPNVTVAASGAALVGWTTSSAVQTSSRPSGGNFPAAGNVASIPTDIPDDFALGGSARGDVIVAWSTFDTGVMKNVVRAAVRSAGAGAFGAPKIVSNTQNYGSHPQIALDEQGDGVLAYDVGQTPLGVDIAVFDASAPEVTLTGPPKVQLKTRAAFRALVSDAFSPFSTTWSFGDGSTSATGASVTHTFTRAGRFTVKVTASDTAGNTASKSLTVTVTTKPLPRCVVPKLKGKTLGRAKKLLRRAHCRLGKVHRPKPPKHRKRPALVVTKTSPGARASRPNGTKVGLTLGPKPKPKPKKKKH
jgi:hypothetical protein